MHSHGVPRNLVPPNSLGLSGIRAESFFVILVMDARRRKNVQTSTTPCFAGMHLERDCSHRKDIDFELFELTHQRVSFIFCLWQRCETSREEFFGSKKVDNKKRATKFEDLFFNLLPNIF